MTDSITVIDICGRSGSGKGYVCEVFSRYGISSVDTDKVYRDILDEKDSRCLAELVLEFGESVLTDKGKLDRRALANKVFSGDGEKLKKLNGITHKYILSETVKKIEEARKSNMNAILIDAPVLFESGFDALCDVTLCVTAPDGVCVERICQRDSRTEAEAVSRLSNQKSEDELREKCTFEIVNDGNADVAIQVCSIIEKLGLGGKDEE